MAEEPARITTWNQYFMELAMVTARKSGDDSMGVGCVIVGPDHEIRSMGYNGLPRGIEYTDERRARPAKYDWTEHGERNAIYNAARVGIPLLGCTAYIACTDPDRGGYAPCANCCRALIQVGIVKIIEFDVNAADTEQRSWATSVETSLQMLREARVSLDVLNPETFEYSRTVT